MDSGTVVPVFLWAVSPNSTLSNISIEKTTKTQKHQCEAEKQLEYSSENISKTVNRLIWKAYLWHLPSFLLTYWLTGWVGVCSCSRALIALCICCKKTRSWKAWIGVSVFQSKFVHKQYRFGCLSPSPDLMSPENNFNLLITAVISY